ncbi:MAG: Hsp20/alpha crystallin family protein [Candidatus Accumulibacter sp.]|jgi:HSP20 family molecular chaperone IbpA|nr:Hsp20/alpha crystallin family protein [Accumulibacter sp.]
MSETKIAPPDRAQSPILPPPVDVFEDDCGITLYADMPGVPKEKLHVRIDAEALVIEGEIDFPIVKDMEASHVEVQSPRFQRTFSLGKELDGEKAQAEFRNGVLKLRIPKLEQAKPRKIEVRID